VRNDYLAACQVAKNHHRTFIDRAEEARRYARSLT